MIKLEKILNLIPNPCYVIEESLLRKNLSLIKDISTSADVEFILAFKAFALWKSFPIFKEYISSTTASSPYEARLAFEEFGSKAHTYSPAYEKETFDDIMRYSSHITFNSLGQFNSFYDDVKRYSTHISCGIRVNPEYSEIITELYNPSAPGTRFGILSNNLPSVLPFGIDGFHMHCHCENNSDVFKRTLNVFEKKFCKWFPQLKWINFGGGHLVTRNDYNIPLLVNTLKSFHSRYPWIRLIMEPGSAFAWETGTLVAKVIDIVENAGIKTAILNVSFTAHMPDCLEMPYHPVIRYAHLIDDTKESGNSLPNTYRLGGNSCLSGDYMGLWKFDHELQIGEPVIFEDMIHYTTVKTNMFNGLNHPSIGMLHCDGSFELYKKFTYHDYRNRMC